MMWGSVMAKASACLIVFAIGMLSVAEGARSAAATNDQPLLHVERIGVPFPSWHSPINGLNATPLLQNPSLTRSALLAPRFHRMLRYGQDQSAKTQTALFVLGRSVDDEEGGLAGASIMSALNPRDGGIVWRTVRNATDPVHSMHLSSDVLVTISGTNEFRVTMQHALTGMIVWSTALDSKDNAAYSGLVDAALIPPATGKQDPLTAPVHVLAPDVIAMDRAGAVHRLAGVNGARMWSKDPIAKQDDDEAVIPLKFHSDKRHAIVVSLVKSSKSGLFSTSETYSLRLTIYNALNGAYLTTIDVSSAEVEMTSVLSDQDSSSNVLIVGRDAESTVDRPPHLVWLQTDGSIKSFAIPLPNEAAKVELDPSTIYSLKPQKSSRFNALVDIAKLRNRGLFVARTNTARAEVFRIEKKSKHVKSIWEMEEEAWDAVFSGGVDRQGKPYLNRVFFGRAQHLLHFHTMWVDAYDEQGQVTGASFRWDHDLHGDVLAAPFEVSPVSEFQLVWRSAFITRSSSVRLLQDERHQWIREEGLTHTTASLIIDLPESKLGTGSGSDARAILDGETFLARLERHLIALQSLPAWTAAAILQGVREIPNLSLESFGIIAPKRVEKPAANKPKPTNLQGAAPLRGVGAQKLGGSGGKQGKVRQLKQGVPAPQTGRTRTQTPEEPPPPDYLAPREANATVTSSLIRDAFGFRKLIVAATKAGKLYAIDSKDGSLVWEKSLFGFGQGEGAEVPTVDVELLALVRPVAGSGADISSSHASQPGVGGEEVGQHAAASTPKGQIALDGGGIVTIVATVQDAGTTFTRMWEIEALSGRFVKGKDLQTGIALFPGRAKDTFLLPIEDEESGQIAAAAVSNDDKVYIWPTTSSVSTQFGEIIGKLYYAVGETQGSHHLLAGYTPVFSSSEVGGQKVWQIPLPQGDTIVSITRAIDDPVASQGKVLGDRRTMYKYLNPHLLVVLTKNVSTRSARVLIVDGVNGKIIFQSALASDHLALTSDNGAKLDPKAVVTENWVTVAFDVDIPATDPQAQYKGAHRQTRLLSIELYQAEGGTDETWQWKGVFSSFASRSLNVGSKKGAANHTQTPSPAVTVYSQLYVLPYGVRSLSTTRTKLGVTSKALILATDQDRLQVLPRRLLDPRRPVGRKPTTQELEEGLITYDATVQDSGKFTLGGRLVPLPRRIRVKASQLESTGVVVVDQSLDLFVTTVAPSGSFDILSQTFNKLQLLLTMTALTAGLLVTRPMVASKMLRMRW